MTGLHYSVVCSQNAKILLVIVCSHERHHVVSRDGRQLVSVRQRHTHRVSQKYHEENPAEGLLLEVTLLRQQLVSLLHLFRPGMVVESCGMVLFRLGFGMTMLRLFVFLFLQNSNVSPSLSLLHLVVPSLVVIQPEMSLRNSVQLRIFDVIQMQRRQLVLVGGHDPYDDHDRRADANPELDVVVAAQHASKGRYGEDVQGNHLPDLCNECLDLRREGDAQRRSHFRQ